MTVEKVINNNIVSAYDETGREVVVMGRGIGFGVKAGAVINQSKIEKIFRIKSQSVAEQFKELLANMPLEHAQISNDIISYAKSTLKPSALTAAVRVGCNSRGNGMRSTS